MLPAVWPMGDAAPPASCAGGSLLLALAVVLLLWRGVPALLGRPWRRRTPNPAHLRDRGQRLNDIVVPVALVVLSVGVLEEDWAWIALGGACVLAWVALVLTVGVMREPETPVTEGSAATLLDVETPQESRRIEE